MLFQKHAIIMSSSVETVVTFPAALLTEQGKEALKIASREDDLDVIRQIANDLKSRGPDKVQIGEIVGIVTTHGTRQVELENEQDVWPRGQFRSLRAVSAQADRMVAAGRTIEVARVRITEAGRRAVAGSTINRDASGRQAQ
jgi:hypothetical protein